MSLADVFIAVKPDLSRFGPALATGMRRSTAKIDVPVKPDLRTFNTSMTQAVRRASATATVPVKPDLRTFNTSVGQAVRRAATTATVPVKPDLNQFGTSLRRDVASSVSRVGKPTIGVKPDLREFGMTPLRRQIDGAARQVPPAKVPVNPDVRRFGREMQSALNSQARGTAVPIPVKPETKNFRSWLRSGLKAEETNSTAAGTRIGANLRRGIEAEGRKTSASGGKLGRAFSSGFAGAMGGGALIAGIGAVTAAVGTTITTSGNFEAVMRQVGVQTGQTGKQFQALSALALDMGAKTQFSAQGAGEAMLELAKGGLSAAQMQAGALSSTLTLASAGGLELGQAAGYMVQGLNTFHLSATQANRVAASLAGAANASSASVQDMGLALAQVGPIANTLGSSIEDVSGALAAFTNNGMSGSDAGTSLKTMFMNLEPSTQKQFDLMTDLGLYTINAASAMDLLRSHGVKPLGRDSDTLRGQMEDLAMKIAGTANFGDKAGKVYRQMTTETGALSNRFFDASGNIKSMADIAGVLQDALGGMSKEERAAALTQLFGSDAMRAGAILTAEGAAGITKYVKATSNQRAATDLAKSATQGFNGALEAFKGSIETLQIQLGQALLPTLTLILRALNGGLLPVFSALISVIGPVLPIVLALAAAWGEYKLTVLAVSAATKAWAAIQAVQTAVTEAGSVATWAMNTALAANPIGIVVVALTALVAGLIYAYKNSETFRKVIQATWNGIKAGASAAWGVLSPILSAVAAWFTGSLPDAIRSFGRSIAGAWSGLTAGASAAWGSLTGVVASAWASVTGATTSGVASVGGAITGGWGAVTGAARTGMTAVAGAVSTGWTVVSTAVGSGLRAVAGAVSTAWAAITGAVSVGVNAVFGVLQGIARFVLTILTPIWAVWRQVIVTEFQVIRLVVTVAVALILRGLGILAGYIQTGLTNVWRNFARVATVVWTTVSGAVQTAWAAVSRVLVAIYTWFAVRLVRAFNVYAAIARNVWAVVSGAATTAWGVISRVVGAIYNWLVTRLVRAFNVYAAIARAVWSGVSGAARASWVVLSAVFVAVYNWLRTRLTNSLNFWLSVVRTVWATASSLVMGAWRSTIHPVVSAINNWFTKTLPGAARSLGTAISARWTSITTSIRNGWTTIHGYFTSMKNWVTTALPNAFRSGADAMGRGFARVQNWVKTPIRWVVVTALNHGILAAFNTVAEKVLGKGAAKVHINSIPLPRGFAAGTEDHRAQVARPGQPRLWNEPETGGEAYIPLAPGKRRRSTSILGTVARTFGYGLIPMANGGTLRSWGRSLAQMGYNISEGPAPFGPVHHVHAPHSRHYDLMAYDVNAGAGTSRAEQHRLARIVDPLRRAGFRVLFMVPGHFNHLHFEVPRGAIGGAISAVSGLAGSIGSALSNLDPRKLINGPLSALKSIPGAGSALSTTLAGVPRRLVGMLVNKAESIVSSVVGDIRDMGGGGGGGGSGQWAPLVARVLAELGRPAGEAGAVLRRIQFESSGNPRAVNLTDSNARAGHPSRGLMQTIPSTFNAYAGPYRGRGINDPLANIYAGVNYALHTYGSLARIDPQNRPRGYDQGGILGPGQVGGNYSGRPERVLDPDLSVTFDRFVEAMRSGRGLTRQVIIEGNVGWDPYELERRMHQRDRDEARAAGISAALGGL